MPRRLVLTRVLIIAGESPAAASSAVVVIPANRSELGSCGALMAVSIALASDITGFCHLGTVRPDFFPRLPVTTQPGTPGLRSPNPWEVAEGPFGADTISENAARIGRLRPVCGEHHAPDSHQRCLPQPENG